MFNRPNNVAASFAGRFTPFLRRARGGLPISFLGSIGSGAPGGGVTTTTGSLDTTGADLLVAVTSAYLSSTNVVTDNKSNTWTPRTVQASGSGPTSRVFYCRPASVGAGHTFTFTNGGTTFPSLIVLAFSNTNATPYDNESGTVGTAASIQPGSITPSVASSVLVTGISYFPAAVPTIDSGFTFVSYLDYVASAHLGVAAAYKILSAAAANNPTWTMGASVNLAVTMAAFKGA